MSLAQLQPQLVTNFFHDLFIFFNNLFETCSWHVLNFLTICHNLFLTCSRLVHAFSQLFQKNFTIQLWPVQNSFIWTLLLLDLFTFFKRFSTLFSWLVFIFQQLIQDLLTTCSQHFHNFFTIFSWLVDLSTTFSWLVQFLLITYLQTCSQHIHDFSTDLTHFDNIFKSDILNFSYFTKTTTHELLNLNYSLVIDTAQSQLSSWYMTFIFSVFDKFVTFSIKIFLFSLYSRYSLSSLLPCFPYMPFWDQTRPYGTLKNSKIALQVQTKLSVCESLSRRILHLLRWSLK